MPKMSAVTCIAASLCDPPPATRRSPTRKWPRSSIPAAVKDNRPAERGSRRADYRLRQRRARARSGCPRRARARDRRSMMRVKTAEMSGLDLALRRRSPHLAKLREADHLIQRLHVERVDVPQAEFVEALARQFEVVAHVGERLRPRRVRHVDQVADLTVERSAALKLSEDAAQEVLLLGTGMQQRGRDAPGVIQEVHLLGAQRRIHANARA